MAAATSSSSGRVTRRVFAFASLLLVTLGTAACGDDEPKQRQAFMAFLQSRVLDRPGLHIPVMSDKDIADFGPYADHYRVLNGFHHRLDNTVSKDLQRAQQLGTPRSLEELRSRRSAIPIVASAMAKLRAELDKAEGDADSARKALKQPPDLKAVYDKAYERMVERPARFFREMMPVVDAMLPAIGALAAFLDDNRDTIELKGNQTVVKSETVRAKLAALIADATKSAEAAADGQRRLRTLVEGR